MGLESPNENEIQNQGLVGPALSGGVPVPALSPLSNPLMYAYMRFLQVFFLIDPLFRTTNVYINGLPPHFPEEELHDLVNKFGGVISVKTFTRNSDPPS